MKKHKKLLRQQAANQDSSVRILRKSRETQSYVGCAGQGAPNFIIDLCDERLRDDGSVAKRLGCMLDVVFLSNKARASATLFLLGTSQSETLNQLLGQLLLLLCCCRCCSRLLLKQIQRSATTTSAPAHVHRVCGLL